MPNFFFRSLLQKGHFGKVNNASVKASTHYEDNYDGFRPPPKWRPERIGNDISPRDFFDKYVSTRTPVIVSGHLLDKGWHAESFDERYLEQNIGDCAVKVEPIGPQGSYGTSTQRVQITMKEFFERARTGEKLYLTTQYEDDSPSDSGKDTPVVKFEDVFPPPTGRLLGHFPLRPKILGNLIPAQVNLWIGHSANGTSSGLHHDFHDNLYMLICGRKRFRLFPPCDAPRLYVNGTLSKVHSNGLISYTASCVRSDGVDEVFAAKAAVRRLEARLQRLQDAGASPKIVAESDEQLEKAVDQLLEIKCKAKRRKRPASQSGASGEPPSFSRVPPIALAILEDQPAAGKGSLGRANPSGRISKSHCSLQSDARDGDTAGQACSGQSARELFLEQFPLLFTGPRLVTCELSAGDMLYLPASWFHEVTSFSELEGVSDGPSCDSKQGVPAGAKRKRSDAQTREMHLAFNYWMQPPSDVTDFVRPYLDEFWEEWWEHVLEMLPHSKHKDK